jgi:hypothetical protein
MAPGLKVLIFLNAKYASFNKYFKSIFGLELCIEQSFGETARLCHEQGNGNDCLEYFSENKLLLP